jgi:hypothetical protein
VSTFIGMSQSSGEQLYRTVCIIIRDIFIQCEVRTAFATNGMDQSSDVYYCRDCEAKQIELGLNNIDLQNKVELFITLHISLEPAPH